MLAVLIRQNRVTFQKRSVPHSPIMVSRVLVAVALLCVSVVVNAMPTMVFDAGQQSQITITFRTVAAPSDVDVDAELDSELDLTSAPLKRSALDTSEAIHAGGPNVKKAGAMDEESRMRLAKMFLKLRGIGRS